MLLAAYAALVAALYLAGRRTGARAIGGFLPDCVVLFRRLLADPSIAGWRKALVAALAGYLALPIDLVPDFIPVIGVLDDAILIAIVLRIVLRGGGEEAVVRHWPGPESSLAVVLRVAYGRRGRAQSP